jgi:hypothetical protein
MTHAVARLAPVNLWFALLQRWLALWISGAPSLGFVRVLERTAGRWPMRSARRWPKRAWRIRRATTQRLCCG